MLTINEFGKSNIKLLSKKDICFAFKQNDILIGLLRIINFNPNIKENHNVYFNTNGTNAIRYATIFKNGIWISSPDPDTELNSVVNSIRKELIFHLNTLLNIFDGMTSNNMITVVKNLMRRIGNNFDNDRSAIIQLLFDEQRIIIKTIDEYKIQTENVQMKIFDEDILKIQHLWDSFKMG
jgi:hypothetical protein